jgi:hypothetical protein
MVEDTFRWQQKCFGETSPKTTKLALKREGNERRNYTRGYTMYVGIVQLFVRHARVLSKEEFRYYDIVKYDTSLISRVSSRSCPAVLRDDP